MVVYTGAVPILLQLRVPLIPLALKRLLARGRHERKTHRARGDKRPGCLSNQERNAVGLKNDVYKEAH
jgi:hypothetical protein